jgi:iron complex transport system substrate-binding protein
MRSLFRGPVVVARRANAPVDRRRLATVAIRLAAAAAVVAAGSWPAAAGRLIVDSSGRKVELPNRIDRVMAAGPPASVVVYVVAPEKLIGWVRKPREEELPYLAPMVRNLPELGRLTGRGDTANVEVVMTAKPDVIVDFGSITPTYVSLADRVQSQTGIPYLLVDGRFADTAAGLRLLGNALAVEERAERLARRVEEILGEVDKVAQSVPAERRPRVYLARGPNGLETGNRGSINTEIIERAGGVNVVDAGLGRAGLVNVSIEQILAWNPDTIVTTDRNLSDSLRSAPGWSETEAVRRGRVFLSPSLPYGWVDAPPSLNRLLGLQWLARLFFPDRFTDDIRAATKAFYAAFYQVDLGEPELERLLDGTRPPK